MDVGSTKHRGISYSTADSGDGKFRWTLHPPKKVADPVEIRQIYSGEVLGRREEAEAVAKKKIDELIGSGELREGPA